MRALLPTMRDKRIPRGRAKLLLSRLRIGSAGALPSHADDGRTEASAFTVPLDDFTWSGGPHA